MYLSLKILLLEVKYNNCKLVCWDWYDIYKTIFTNRSIRYYLIEKYNIDNFTPPTVYNYNLKCDRNNKIFVTFNAEQTQKRMMLRTNLDGEFYLKGFQGDYRFIRSDKFKDYGKRTCKICKNLNYCINIHIINRSNFGRYPLCSTCIVYFN